MSKHRIPYSDFLVYRRLQAEAEANHVLAHGTVPQGRDPLADVEVVRDTSLITKSAAPATPPANRFQAIADELITTLRGYTDRKMKPLEERIAALEAGRRQP